MGSPELSAPAESTAHSTTPGFALATATLTVLMPSFLVMPRAIARRNRLRRGRCIHCKYDIAGLAQCPEYGLAVHGAN